jgi:hypothetical protein
MIKNFKNLPEWVIIRRGGSVENRHGIRLEHINRVCMGGANG